MEIIFKGTTLQICFEPQSEIIAVSYFGIITKSEEFKAATCKAGEFAIAHKVRRWLLDQRNMNLHPHDHQWFYQHWQPSFDKAMPCSRKVAIIPAKNLFSEFSVKIENQRLAQSGNLQVRYFTTLEDARAWLLSDLNSFPIPNGKGV
ncbi:MAG: STAS/SEC14 domain-containing protein [Cytophagales bacterium]|nr:STAS/SEC14 domain-containing protein [Bernardetiaceae bacterium]MDW8210244.1 STAS/SEC14 domain-containing protein [Cytophagales bacterium]